MPQHAGERVLRLHVGSYAHAGGEGLVAVGHDPDDGWHRGKVHLEAQNASFGCYSTRFGLHYLVDEQGGTLGAYRVDDGSCQRLAVVGTGGEQPCYVALDAAETCLAVANYGSGDIALFPLEADGELPVAPPVLRQNHGSGPVADRQDGPHAHCVLFSPDQRWLYHVDLGTDEILAYAFDVGNRAIGSADVAFRAPSGSGPRHLVFHPRAPVAVLVSELASTLTLLKVGNGRLEAAEVQSTLPTSFEGESLGGHLGLNRAGDRVYVTNRGHDSIAVFTLDERGRLKLLQHLPSGGASPRFFLLLEEQRRLILANEEGSNLSIFMIEDDGRLAPLGTPLSVAGAACVMPVRSPVVSV